MYNESELNRISTKKTSKMTGLVKLNSPNSACVVRTIVLLQEIQIYW